MIERPVAEDGDMEYVPNYVELTIGDKLTVRRMDLPRKDMVSLLGMPGIEIYGW